MCYCVPQPFAVRFLPSTDSSNQWRCTDLDSCGFVSTVKLLTCVGEISETLAGFHISVLKSEL